MTGETQKTHSEYFEISIYDTPHSDDPDSPLSSREGSKDEVCFVYKNGKPDKIGDGSFGTVYKGRKRDGITPVAIKLLYDNITHQLRQISDLSDEELNELITSLVKEYAIDEAQTIKLRETIITHKESGYGLPKIVQTEMGNGGQDSPESPSSDKSETSSLKIFDAVIFLNELMQRANSSAIERFGRERTITRDLLKKIRKWLGSESSMKDTEGIVEVKGGTESFREYIKLNGKLADIGDYFRGEKIKVSDYVLVMDLYDYSLKDLLERPDKTSNSKSGYQRLKEMSHDERARESLLLLVKVADGLRKLHNAGGANESFLHRDIKPGNIFIKNTNVSIPGEKTDGKVSGFNVALGDLGSLPEPLPDPTQRDFQGTTMWANPIEHGYARGTQHYRSPEQKYYKDVADAQIVFQSISKLRSQFPNFFEHGENPYNTADGQDDGSANTKEPSYQKDDNQALQNGHSSNDKGKAEALTKDRVEEGQDDKLVVLIVQDPKFKNTLFDKGDIVTLSKDSTHARYKIRYFIPPQLKSNQEKNSDIKWTEKFVFVLDTLASGVQIKEDSKTQVEFYKKQSYRTDLFGIGAVLFDMLTVGHSAEQFYESIRKHEGMSVERIVDQYDALTKGEMETENPDFGEIFKPFRHPKDKTYPDTQIVKFILQCMLYQSEDTFFGQRKKSPWTASSLLYTEISGLSEYYNKKQELNDSQSMLIHGFDSESPEGTSTRLSEKIDMLQGLSKWPGVDGLKEEPIAANRLLYGAYYFWQVTNYVREVVLSLGQEKNEGQQAQTSTRTSGQIDNINKQNAQKEANILRQMLPTSFLLQLPDSDRKQVGSAKIDLEGVRINLLEDIRENRLELLIRSAANSFVATELAGMRRDIVLFIPKEQEQQSERIKCRYWYQDASIVSRQILKGDWIDFDEQLWIVAENPTDNELVIERDRSTEGNVEDQPRADQASGSDPSDRYIKARFIAKINPVKYYLEMLGIYLQHLIFTYSPVTTTTRDRIDIRSLLKTYGIGNELTIMESNESEWDPRNNLEDIHERYIDMFMRLTLHEAGGSYYRQISSNIPEGINDAGRPKAKTAFEVFNSEIQSTARKLYEYILEEVLKIPYGNISDHPDKPVTQELAEFKQMFDELRKNPIDIENKIIESNLIEGGPYNPPLFIRSDGQNPSK